AFLFTESINKEALTKVLVSKTKWLIIIFENIVQNFLGKTALFHLLTEFIQIFQKMFFSVIVQYFTDTLRNLFGDFLFELGRRKSPFFSCGFIQLNDYSFHNVQFIVPNLQNI